MPEITPEESANRRNIRKAQASIDLEFSKVIDKVFKSAAGLKLINERFNVNDHPAFLKKLNEAMKNFRINVEAILVNGIQDSFTISQTNFINTVYTAYDGRAITDPVKAILNETYEGPLNAFLNRSVNGLNLSDRVWQMTYQLQREIEWTIFAGLSEGQSAQTMARSLKRSLKNPDSLFRRVRNAKGKLVLSKPARQFNPGQGVYRSSYKNAMRVSRTEINTAYRTADHEKFKSIPFVLGVEIRLSDAHPRYDICDELVGIYPASFKFTGYHTQCLCYTIPILAPRDEFARYQRAVLDGTADDFVFQGRVSEVPENAKNWVEENRERIQGWKSEPWFIRDNKELRELVK